MRKDVIEAAEAFGATRWQILRGVQLPLAGQAIMLGFNQVIMMALSIVVIASLIGAGGLGDPVLGALQTQQIGEELVAGVLIVFMAMWLGDQLGGTREAEQPRGRVFAGAQARPASSRRALGRGSRRHPRLALRSGLGDWPSGWGFSIVDPVTSFLNWITTHLTGVSRLALELPHAVCAEPAPAVPRGLPLAVGRGSSRRRALVARGPRRAILLAGCVALLGLMQAPVGYTFQGTTSYDFSAWNDGMQTLSLVIVALVLDLVIGIPLGIAAYRWPWFDRLMRPGLDFLQTLPAFVYLIPVVAMFGVGNLAGVTASLIYALPAAVRATTLGLHSVQHDVIEAGHAFGSTRWQLLRKVELPIARPYLALAVNQTILLVMAEVVVAGLVGAGGLGLDVVTGFSRSEVGLGAAAGLAMVLMGVVLDRLSQSNPERGRAAAS